jgi:hypothetical protein
MIVPPGIGFYESVGAGALLPIPRVWAFLSVRVAGSMLFNEPPEKGLTPATGAEAASAVAVEALAEEDEVVEDDCAAAVTAVVRDVVETDDGDEAGEGVDDEAGGETGLEPGRFTAPVVVGCALNELAASDLGGWGTLDETLLLELEDPVPDDVAEAVDEEPAG